MTRCIFIDSTNELSVREIQEEYRPQGSQALVKVKYSGINPADIAHGRFLGLNNNVCGYEFCGMVIEAGPSSRYASGDMVFGSNEVGKTRPKYHCAHQDFLVVESNSLSMKQPSHLPNTHAAALSIMVRTAADVLVNHFQIPFPELGIQGLPPTGAILIWGGASTVGIAAIQLAKVMGVGPIFATASLPNHDTLVQLGATECFDYRDPSVVIRIQDAIKKSGKDLAYVFDTVCKEGSPGTITLCESVSISSTTKYACTLPQPRNEKWNMVLASRGCDFPFPPPVPAAKADPERETRLESVMQWAARNYGKYFQIPRVKVVSGGEDGILAIKDVFAGKSSLQKVVIEHPI